MSLGSAWQSTPVRPRVAAVTPPSKSGRLGARHQLELVAAVSSPRRRLDGLGIAIWSRRSREAPTATRRRFGHRDQRSQSGADPRERQPTAPGGGKAGSIGNGPSRLPPAGPPSRAEARLVPCTAHGLDGRGNRRKERAAEGVVLRGPTAQCATRVCRLSHGRASERQGHLRRDATWRRDIEL